MSDYEPLLDPKNRRYKVFPILYQDIYDVFLKHRSLFWVPDEIKLVKDLYDLKNKLNDNEKNYIIKVVVFFATTDLIVNENIKVDVDDVTVPEYIFYLHDKEAREDTHTLMYARLLNTFVEDEKERERLINSIEDTPAIKRKIDWFRKYFSKSFAHRRISSAITEGIFFSGAFCSIYWLKKRGLMPGLCDSNDFIAREEGIHYETECMIYNGYVVNKLTDIEIEEMIDEGVNIEIEFVKYILPVSLLGINSDVMSDYIRFIANRLSIMLLNKKLYNIELPLEWMAMLSQETKSNFFEHKPTTYAKYQEDEKIVISCDF